VGKIVFIVGGARSGKSRYAEKLVSEISEKKLYIATGLALDSEMEDRIKRHRKDRGDSWVTLEASTEVEKALKEESFGEVVLLDCMTVLVTNLMFAKDVNYDEISMEEFSQVEIEITKKIKSLLNYMEKDKRNYIIVSNEVGLGLVPPYALGRYFRDIAGRINQIVASYADEAFFIASGLPLKLK